MKSNEAHALLSVLIVFSLLFACNSASANPNLSGPPGMWEYLLVGLLIAGAVVVLLVIYVWYGVKQLLSENRRNRSKGKAMLFGLALLVITLSTFFIDYNFYILSGNKPDDVSVVKKAYQDYYFELEDGRIFFRTGTVYFHFKSGSPVVVRYSNGTNNLQFHKVIKYTSSEITRIKLNQSGKWFSIPIIPSFVNRYRLAPVIHVSELRSDWQFDDLIAHKEILLYWCCDPAWTKLLVQRGGDPNYIQKDKSPIFSVTDSWYFASHGTKKSQNIEKVLSIMLTAGVDVNGLDKNGDTALHRITKNIHKKQVRWLLDNGADPNIRNKEGKTVADLLYDEIAVMTTNAMSDRTRNYRYQEMKKMLQMLAQGKEEKAVP
ncbi:MAG: hypothetical protein KAT04_01160 [Methylococcales bacterium]|nr:hypothetical protein [Methylococcales bacterium]